MQKSCCLTAQLTQLLKGNTLIMSFCYCTIRYHNVEHFSFYSSLDSTSFVLFRTMDDKDENEIL